MTRSIVLAHEVDWGGWRNAARRLALENVPPEEVVWSVETPSDLFASQAEEAEPPAPAGTFNVPRALVELAQTVIQHCEPARFALLYQLIWRTHQGDRHLLEQVTDPEVQRAHRLAQAVRRDTHKMRAFVRFRAVTEGESTRYVAWFEPDNYIVEANAPFFMRRFATMVWSILTPYRSAHWNGEELSFAAGAAKADVPDDDRLEAYWRAYFSSIFNPARLKIKAMTSEMPRKYWRNLPEAAAIPDLIRQSRERTATMVDTPTVSPARARRPLPPRPLVHVPGSQGALAAGSRHLPALRPLQARDADRVRRGAGRRPPHARRRAARRPGGSGRPALRRTRRADCSTRALAEAGIDRSTVYVTNAVKHFKFEPRGKRRIHAKPDRSRHRRSCQLLAGIGARSR